MAGQGPAPKDPEVRRNRTPPARGEWVDLPPLTRKVLPPLPKRGKGEGPWPARTRAVWTAWRNDPVTAQYSEADIAYALDTIALHAAMTPSTAAEVRLRSDALGLTPKGKRDLRWRINREELPEPERRPTSERSTGRRGRLELVKS